jgi:glycine dehydrogenase
MEIAKVASGEFDAKDNPLKNAPHTVQVMTADKWEHAYSREVAAYPVASLRRQKYWSPVGRADNVYGDRNLFCSCVPIADYE